jgi:hypothetical protein
MIASRFGFTNTKLVIRGQGVTARLAFDTHKSLLIVHASWPLIAERRTAYLPPASKYRLASQPRVES